MTRNRMRNAGLVGAFVATLIAVAMVAEPALAQTGNGQVVGQCSDYAGLTSRIVMCIRDTISDVTGYYFDGFYQIVRVAIAGFITFGIAIYGVLASMGLLEKISRDTFVLLVKLSMIGYFSMNANMLYHMEIDMMDAAAETVVRYTPGAGGANAQLGYDKAVCVAQMKQYADDTNTPYSPAWLGMDCLIDSIIGIRATTGNSISDESLKKGAKNWYNMKIEGTGMGRSILYFLFASLQTSVLGVLVGIIGFIFLYSFVFLIGKAMFTYLAGYIGVAFMMIFAPIFIPLVLFRKTKEYFDKWVKLTISFGLQPILILIFIIFSLAAVDLAMFSGDYSVMYRIAGEASRQPNFNLNEYLTSNEAVKKKPAEVLTVKAGAKGGNTDSPALKEVGGIIDGLSQSECSKLADSLTEEQKKKCAQYWSINFWHDSIDWEKLATVRNPPVQLEGDATTPGQQISREIVASILLAAIVVFVMNNLLKVVPGMINDLVGDSFQSPALYSAVSRRHGYGLDSAAGSVGSGILQSLRR